MTTNTPESSQPNGNRLRNLLIAIAAIVVATIFALGLKTQTAVATLPAMAKASIPYDVAITNGKPTLMEFYADWCSSCQAMAPEMAKLKEQYGDRVNFVMLNVDNQKWLPEIVSYHVDGIPHWVYLDKTGTAEAEAIGEIPAQIMADNLVALADGVALPHTGTSTGQTSAYTPPNAVKQSSPDDPRAHGSQVKG
jgi:thiol-disulfide isomerase/thioredoxin